jgi:hypothetical protein
MYKFTISYTGSFEGRIIFGLELIAKDLFSIHIDSIGGNRFCLDYIETRLFLELELELSLTR